MDPVLRSLAIYTFLLVVFRLAGKRTLADITPFDLVLLLIIGEATSQGLLGDEHSVTNAVVVVTTLVVVDVLLSLAKQHVPALARVTEGVPLLLVDDGELLHERMDRARVDEHDLLEAARTSQGIGSLAEIRYAVLERNGVISIIPRR
jgi:uncharacterized membrane protein YcaP (DUF421 family)